MGKSGGGGRCSGIQLNLVFFVSILVVLVFISDFLLTVFIKIFLLIRSTIFGLSDLFMDFLTYYYPVFSVILYSKSRFFIHIRPRMILYIIDKIFHILQAVYQDEGLLESTIHQNHTLV